MMSPAYRPCCWTEHGRYEAQWSCTRGTARSNTYGTVDLGGVVFLLQEVGVEPLKARWYPRYV